MEVVEVVTKVIALVLSTGALVTGVVKLVGKYKKIENYGKDIAELSNKIEDLRTSSLAQFQTFAAEQTIQTHVLNAVLDGLQQLGCNHTVPKARKELEDYFEAQAHKVEKL